MLEYSWYWIFQEKMIDTTLAIVAIVSDIGLLGLVFVESISVQQPAEAKGCDILSGEHITIC